jgi:hypothetical protein
MNLQFRKFRIQYSIERISAAIGDILTIQWALYCKHSAKYSAQPPANAMYTVVPAIYSVIAAPHIQASIFNWTNLRCYWNYVDNSASVILQPWCQYSAHPLVYAIWTVVPAIYSTITAPYIQASIHNWAYLRCHCWYIDNSMCVILQTWYQIQHTSSSWCYLTCGSGHIQWKYSSAYFGFNIQMNVSPPLLEICREANAPYTANIVPNIAHILQITLSVLCSRPYTVQLQLHIFRLQYSTERIWAAIGDKSTIQCALICNLCAKYQFTLFELLSLTYTMYLHLRIIRLQYSTERISTAIGLMSTIQQALYCKHGATTAHILQFTPFELWSRTYTMYLQFHIFRLQYSIERIYADIGHISRIQCALYSKRCAKYSAYPSDYAMWSVVPAIYSVISALHIQASIFKWTYLRWYWRYVDKLMHVKLQTWCQIQRTSSSLRCVKCGPGHIQRNYSTSYSGFNIRFNVSVLLLEISRQFNERYTANSMPNTAQNHQFAQCEQWSRRYKMYFLLRTFRIQYSTELICADIGDISTIQCA